MITKVSNFSFYRVTATNGYYSVGTLNQTWKIQIQTRLFRKDMVVEFIHNQIRDILKEMIYD